MRTLRPHITLHSFLVPHLWLKVNLIVCPKQSFHSSLSRGVSCSAQNTQHFILYFFPLFQVSKLRGSDGVGVLRHDSMGIFASSPPGGVTPHSARKVQIVPAGGISSELSAHQMARAGVVAHSSPPAGVVAQVVRSLHAAFGSWFLRLVLHFRTSSSLVLVLRRAYEGRARH